MAAGGPRRLSPISAAVSALFPLLVNLSYARPRYSTRLQVVHSQKVTRVAGGFVVGTRSEMRHLHIFVNGCYYGVNNAASSAENRNNPPECVSSSIMWGEDFIFFVQKRTRLRFSAIFPHPGLVNCEIGM